MTRFLDVVHAGGQSDVECKILDNLMKSTVNAFSERYRAVLRAHLKRKPGVGMDDAVRLGRRAVLLGIGTLGIAGIHQEAVATLQRPVGGGWIKRTDRFFAEAITPIVATHRAARSSNRERSRLRAVLARRTLALASSNRQLARGTIRRKSVEAALKQSAVQNTKLLRDSLLQQEGLRHLTRKVLVTQEDERSHIGRELQDEIAQTLLGINVRLLALKQESRSNADDLKGKISNAQKLMRKSAHSVRRVAAQLRSA